MRTAIRITRGLVGFTGALQVILGLLFWTGHARGLVSTHMVIGLVFVLSLLTLAVLCAIAGAPAGLVAATLLWGLMIPVFGMAQIVLLPGPNHWIVRAAHLLTGIVGMAMAGMLMRSAYRVHSTIDRRAAGAAARPSSRGVPAA